MRARRIVLVVLVSVIVVCASASAWLPRLTKTPGTTVSSTHLTDNPYIQAACPTLQKCEEALMGEHGRVWLMRQAIVDNPDVDETTPMPDWFCERVFHLGYDWGEGCH
jgi:hypothetical protein